MNQTSNSIAQKERTAQLIWTAVILSFFLIQAVIWIFAISVTANDQSHAVVAGYDEKALLWDDEKARRLASAELGWQAELVVDSTSDIRGYRTLTVNLIDAKISDATKSPVEKAKVELTAFHRGRAAVKQQISLTETEDGVYVGRIQIHKGGQWQFEGTATRGEHTFMINDRQSIKAGS